MCVSKAKLSRRPTKTPNTDWHKYLRGFCDGLGTTDPARVSNASFLGKELFELWMPPDYEREGKAGVFSATVIRELYLFDLRGWKPSGGAGKSEGPRELMVGQFLSGTQNHELRLAAVYRSLNGGPASALLEPEEELAAKALLNKLERAKSQFR